MENRKILLYVLSGSWNHSEFDGTGVLGVSEDIELLQKKLDEVANNLAGDYLHNTYGGLTVEKGERHYEVTDEAGAYAKFYITEHYVEISEALMGAISREMSKIDRTNDVEEYLRGLFESSNIDGWQYEYMTRKPEVMKQILELFDKLEDWNTPFNSTMDIVVGNVRKEILLNDEVLEYLWEEFGDFPGVDEEDCLLDDFLGFEAGTHREDVWHWFDEHHSRGVAFLMFGGEQ